MSYLFYQFDYPRWIGICRKQPVFFLRFLHAWSAFKKMSKSSLACELEKILYFQVSCFKQVPTYIFRISSTTLLTCSTQFNETNLLGSQPAMKITRPCGRTNDEQFTCIVVFSIRLM